MQIAAIAVAQGVKSNGQPPTVRRLVSDGNVNRHWGMTYHEGHQDLRN